MNAAAKLKTNLDTDFLKLVAIVSMTVDHVGSALFPQFPVFRWIGRIAFPIFCYCLTVGLLYTRDIKRYLGRLAAFAIISQPFWILAFNADDFWGNLTNMNIFFTLLVSLWAAWGFKEKKWWVFIAGVLLLGFFNFDYALTGIILILIFYLCRNKPALGAALFCLSYIPALWNGYAENPLNFAAGGLTVDFSFFAIFAALLIFPRTHTGIKIPKWFFYAYYPAHLLAIFLVKLLLFRQRIL